MRDALLVSVMSVLPRRTLSSWMGRAARTRWSRLASRAFVWAYGVDLSEAQVPEGGFDSLDALFTRALREGARPVSSSPDAVVSPVDGRCVFAGEVVDDRLPVAPGRSVSWSTLVGEATEGPVQAMVLYLSPRDYHRVHAPEAGEIVHHHHVPGTLWPVFDGVVRRVADLYARNERVVLRLRTGRDPVTMVLIGAFGVGGMIVRATQGAVARGEEVAVFHLGSTVVISAPAGRWAWVAQPGASVRMGQTVARWTDGDTTRD